jgi:hypothetical protein
MVNKRRVEIMVKEEKILNVKISKDIYKELKIQATMKEISLKEIVERAFRSFLSEDDEPLTEEDIKDIDEAKQEYKEGKCQLLSEIIEELDNANSSK